MLAEDAATPRGVGRPSRAVRYAAGGPVALGVAVDVDSLAVCAVGLDGVVRAHRRLPRDHRELGPDAVFDGAAALAAEVCGEVGARVLGAGLALPALLSTAAGAAHRADRALAAADSAVAGAGSPVVLRAPNLPRLDGSRPADALAARLGLPVTVDNEATLGALAHLDRAPNLVYVSAGIGVGGGIVLDGRVYRGARGLAGELGHVVVDRAGPACGCGGRGCVERYAGAAALLADAGAADLDALVDALAGGDGRAVAATTRAAAALGTGLASVLNVLDVPVVVLGGTFARLAPHVEPALSAELARRSLAPAQVLTSSLGDAAAVRGAAESVLAAVQRDPDRLTVAATARAGHGVDALHRLGELDRLVVHQRARVERRVGHHAVHAAALHAEVAGVVERQDRRLAQVASRTGACLSTLLTPDHLHALVDAVEQHLGALDLAHRADQLAVVVVLVEVVRGLPAEVAARLDLRGDVAEHVARVLVVDDRLRAARRVGLRPVQRRLVGRARDADGGDPGDRPRPGEVAVDQQVAVAARALDQVAGRARARCRR